MIDGCVWAQIEVDPAFKGVTGAYINARPQDEATVARAAQINVKATSESEALSVLLHEIQHGIQDIKGFATGESVLRIAAIQDAA